MDSLEEFTGRAKRKPYELALGGDKVMRVKHPTIEQWAKALKRDGIDGFLSELGVDAETAGIVADAFPGADFGSDAKLVARMAEFFGQGN